MKKMRRPLSRAEFERELAAAVEDRPCDPGVKAFWDQFCRASGAGAAVVAPRGIKLRRKSGGAA
ncbi:hypothetical protein [Gordonia sp. 852002-50395_SCH5434458]|uniref:hypothetical protein n=1 Tax=Gordonia sp. 852002-50395_SCH5434458 TaxID=1834090 RepID=UPI0007EAF9B0|nr:hypothetical protein [Gordonia sp. 852002-50395_SCH5434458]OBC02689.1 hypothetical protein A5785_02435 [Gordonia sp. 852002-50395_SCH5434458]